MSFFLPDHSAFGIYFFWILIASAVCFIGITKSGFGSGVGIMIPPTVAISFSHIPGYGPEAALGLLLPLLIAGDLLAIYQYRHLFSMRIVKHLLPGTLIGVVVGGVLLWTFHQNQNLVGGLIKLEIGFESILLVGLHWWRQWRGVQNHLMPEPWRSGVTGGFAAVSSTMAHAAGPIIAMYLLPLGLDRQLYVGTTAIYFFILNTAKLPAYWSAGEFAKISPRFSLKFLPLVLVGAIIGFYLNRRINDKLFVRIIYVVTFALGWYLLVNGVLVLV